MSPGSVRDTGVVDKRPIEVETDLGGVAVQILLTTDQVEVGSEVENLPLDAPLQR